MSDDREDHELTELDYLQGRRSDKYYVSGAFKDDTRKRFAEVKFDPADRCAPAWVRNQLVLKSMRAGAQQLKALFYTDTRQIESLAIQSVSVTKGKPGVQKFVLHGDEIDRLLAFAAFIRTAQIVDGEGGRYNTKDFETYDVSRELLFKRFQRDPQLLTAIMERDVRATDVAMLGIRRSALARFDRLLHDPEYFERQRRDAHGSAERVWQGFFEENKWIFGYGLFFVFSTSLDDRTLEQTVVGANFMESGKKPDALLKTRGRISSLCFVEIKTHETRLLAPGKPYRADVWPPSDELIAAVAQVQRTVYSAETRIRDRIIRLHDSDGNPTGEEAFLVRPRSIVVAGRLDEFASEHGSAGPRFTSFELFRRQLDCPEIITFDELYERARYITEAEADEAERQV